MGGEPFGPDNIVKTCSKLESGLNLTIEGLRGCINGALSPPLFCSCDEISSDEVTKDFIIEKRKEYIRMLNDDHSDIDCKRCLMVEKKRYGDISFSRLGHLDLQHYSICNLNCTYCNYTRRNQRLPPQYDALKVLRLFSQEDVLWNAHVDFSGGEPSLLDNLEEYLAFFRNRRIRVLMHTNAVRFHHAIYDGLADGSLYWVTTSLDAGVPSTFKALRGRDEYLGVLENLSRYAVAGSNGKGMLSVKYIVCESNCSDDDIAGFAYAMLALRPQKVWLTFDFTPLYVHQFDHDYSNQIQAYAKLYLLLKKHGIEAFHYYGEALASVSSEGRDVMNRVFSAIANHSAAVPLGVPDLLFKDFRNGEPLLGSEPDKFSVNPLKLTRDDGRSRKWSLHGKRVLLAPACPRTQQLLFDPQIQQADWIGFVDRNPIQQGKTIDGRTIFSYEAIRSVNPDVILVASPEKHRIDILKQIAREAPGSARIAELA
ncbi:MAG TPA: radical SAM protein [Syntrophobacteraceae bacterium]|nr:radical SAM protein [Syntrophobacteraceae bacterium]